MVNKEKLPLVIKSMRLNQDLINDLHKTLENEFSKISEKASIRKTYFIYFEKDHEREAEDLEEFKEEIMNEIATGFQLTFDSESAEVNIDAKMDDIKCYIKSKKMSGDWALVTKSGLSDTFKKYRTVRSSLSDSLIVAFSVLLACGLSYLISLFISKVVKFDATFFLLYFALGALGSFYLFCFLILWLFPKIETEYMSRVKHRNQILTFILGSIAIPIVLEIIF